MAHHIERCAALYMHLICTALYVCMRFIIVKKSSVMWFRVSRCSTGLSYPSMYIYQWCRVNCDQETKVFGVYI